jgi:formate dehydrogenase major subunit
MTNTFQDVAEQSKCLFIIGSNTTEQHPVFGMQLRQAVLRRGVPLIVADPRRTSLARMATIHLRHWPGTDIILLNALMNVIINEELYDKAFVAERTENFDELKAKVQAYPVDMAAEQCGVKADDIRAAARLMAKHHPGALMYAMGITQHTTGHQNVMACADLQMLLGNLGVPGGGVNPLRGQSNVQGACDMGGLPNYYPGYQLVVGEASHRKFASAWGALPALDKPGLTLVEMMHAAERGDVRALMVLGENPVLSDPDSNHVRHCLESVEFLVVEDIFPTETAQLADVVLAGAAYSEKEGTFTNSERRVQLVRRAVNPQGEARPDWEIIGEIAQRTLALLPEEVRAAAEAAPQGGWDYMNSAEIAEEISELTPSYGGIRHHRLEKGGLQWPCPDEKHPGTQVLHVGKFTRGLGHFAPVDYLPPQEQPDEEFPMLLSTGRVLFHYHTGSLTRRSAGLLAIYPEGTVEIHPSDAARLEIAANEVVEVTSRRGQVQVKAEVTDRVQPGMVFMTFHFPEAAANMLTNAALDPVSKIPEYKACAVRVSKLAPCPGCVS